MNASLALICELTRSWGITGEQNLEERPETQIDKPSSWGHFSSGVCVDSKGVGWKAEWHKAGLSVPGLEYKAYRHRDEPLSFSWDHWKAAH